MEYVVAGLGLLLALVIFFQALQSWRKILSDQERIDRLFEEIGRLLKENRSLVQLLAAYKMVDREPTLGPQFIGPGPYQPPASDADDFHAGIPVPPAEASPDSMEEEGFTGVSAEMLGGSPGGN